MKRFYDNKNPGFDLTVKEMICELNKLCSYYASLDRSEHEEKLFISLQFALKKVKNHNEMNIRARISRRKNKTRKVK